MKPRIVITVGDPAGIGPEVVAAAVKDPQVLSICLPVVVGDPVAFKRQGLRLPKVEMLPAPGLRKDFPVGQPSREAGLSAVESLRLAAGLIEGRQAQALVTAPISKESLHLADAGFPGHTEWLANQCGAKSVAMLMVAGKLRALLLTRHVPIARVAATLTVKTIEDAGILAADFVSRILKKRKPRMVACGLNPHAGDNGLIGKEEQTRIVPALQRLRKRGILILGPRPADTVFREMAEGAYDLALAAYHDQGMIPLKLHAPQRMVNVTLGLPYIRTSPAHGTAYDIAGQGKANPAPLKEAIRLAVEYACASR
jgi:4-hydroxythreonine-4-phosphate dehydrogenase